MQKRRSARTIKRLEIKFIVDGTTYTGITSNVSEHGIFIRTKMGIAPGKRLDVELYLPSGIQVKLYGIVKRTVKTPFTAIKNGMGIELVNPPVEYRDFLKTLQ